MIARPGAHRDLSSIALASFLLAFSARMAWILRVQSPFDSIYSDMAGYVDRAEQLLWHVHVSDPRTLTLFPPGAHLLMALEFLVFGRHARGPISVVHALVGAVPAACAPVLTYRLLPSRGAAMLSGLLVALWEPQVCFVGFFSTEVWFSAAIAVHAWLASRDERRAGNLVARGVAAIVAIVVRPQFLLTCAYDVTATCARALWRRGRPAAAKAALWLSLPVVVGLVATSYRYHALAGRWGLVSASGLNRVWADTDVCQVNASWTTPDGGELSYYFTPPSKPPVKPSDTVTFRGFIVDPDILDGIRRDRTRGLGVHDRVLRRIHNVELLLFGNLPWPESNYRDVVAWMRTSRAALEAVFRELLCYGVLPASVLGLALTRPSRTKYLFLANLLTVVVASAFFFGEARYHVPYDPFLIALAAAGLFEAADRIDAVVRRYRAQRR